MASKLLKGYTRLPGRPRRYLTPSGVEITEYQYRSRKARRQKGSGGKPVFRNYSQQRRFRESQDFLRLRFNIRSIDPSQLIDSGSDLEAAMAEVAADPNRGKSGLFGGAQEADSTARGHRLALLLDAMGAPDYYFWRFWYSETRG